MGGETNNTSPDHIEDHRTAILGSITFIRTAPPSSFRAAPTMSIPRRAATANDPSSVEKLDNGKLCCCVCQRVPAALAVRLPHPRFPQRRRVIRHMCVKHFYTTPAARTISSMKKNPPPQRQQQSQSSTNSTLNATITTNDPAAVEILDAAEFDVQLKATQELFAEAFVQLQQEITEEAARAFTAQQSKNDPLAILHDLHKTTQKTRHKRAARGPKDGAADAGGFLRTVALPERLRRTQEPQHQQSHLNARVARNQRSTTAPANSSKRRRPTTANIWSQVRDDTTRGSTSRQVAVAQRTKQTSRNVADNRIIMEQSTRNNHPNDEDNFFSNDHDVSCKSCASPHVRMVGSNASRNHDLTKGETWGSKDRAEEVFHRYECQKCGLTWNEEA